MNRAKRVSAAVVLGCVTTVGAQREGTCSAWRLSAALVRFDGHDGGTFHEPRDSSGQCQPVRRFWTGPALPSRWVVDR